MGALNKAAHHLNFSVLVIAAALSVVGAMWSPPDGPESAPERPAAMRRVCFNLSLSVKPDTLCHI